jgi:hypothetical protein
MLVNPGQTKADVVRTPDEAVGDLPGRLPS